MAQPRSTSEPDGPVRINAGIRNAGPASEVLHWLALGEWHKGHGGAACPPERIPDAEALVAWLPDCDRDTWASVYELGVPLSGRTGGSFHSSDFGPAAILASVAVIAHFDGRWRIRGGAWHGPAPAPGVPVIEWHPDSSEVAAALEAMHRRWLDAHEPGKHPLGPLVKAWQQRPLPVEPDRHESGILPFGLLPDHPRHEGSLPVASAASIRRSRRELPAPGAIIEPDPQGLLPFGGQPPSAIPRPAPLVLVDATGIGELQPGRGARLDKRLLLYSLLAMPLNQRVPGGRYELRRTVRELAAELWPNKWRPSQHGGRLVLALNAMHLAKVRMSDGSKWLPAVMRREPNPYDLASEAVIQLELPPDCDRGPLIDRPQLVAEGVRSDPAFDLWLGLAYYWDQAKARNGGHRIYATRPKARRNRQGVLLDASGQPILGRGGRPERNWQHPRAVLGGFERHPHADKLPALTPDQIRRLAYGGVDRGKTKQQRSRELQRARALIREHERAGRVVVEADGPCWRILETWPARTGRASYPVDPSVLPC